MEEYMEKYNNWLNSPIIDKETKEELLSIKDDDNEIRERFTQNLEFGTAGLRGIIGNGTNRMNIYTVGMATQGLANFINKNNPENKPVVISYDSRNFSKEFSKQTALILNANGIKTYLFDELNPVPILSFAIRELHCIAGVMITASHNPSKYNGYKVYFEDGAQIVDPVATGIIEEVNKIKLEDIKITDDKNELFNIVPEYVFEKYINVLNGLVLNRDIIKEMNPDMKIVYTPLNGSGNKPVQTILKTIGFDNVYVVKEQEKPDGNFTTCPSPNPENPAVYELALKLAEKENADVILATDPDADRLGIYSFDKVSNTYKSFTGNMSALLIAEYRLSILKERGLIPDNGIIVKSLVSSNLADAIANEYNLKLKDVLTGFKYIGEQIKLYEQNRDYTYMFGFEESYGCLFGTYARDKDGVAAVMALAEAAAYYKSKGLTLCDQMENIYKKYGYYLEETVSIEKEGLAGIAEIQKIMQNIRENPFKSISGYQVLNIKDYKLKTDINLISDETKETDLPTANVLYYIIENDAWIAVRPSGTEPKIKFYVGVRENSKEEAENKFNKIKEFLLENIK